MNQKNVLILSGVTVAALAIAAMALRRNDTTMAIGERELLFPELSARINDVAELRIEKNDKTVTLRREGGQWKLADRGGYPAKFEEVKELAVRIAGLEIEEAKTSKKANHAKLAVEWPATAEEDSEAGVAGLVTLEDASGKELAAVVVGKSEWQNQKPKVYVRRAAEDQVYLCSARGSLDVVPDAKSWIEPKFVELPNDRVQSVTIEHHDGELVEIDRSAVNHTQFKVKNLPPDETERYEGVANGVAQALGYGLSLEDVRPVTEIDFTQSPVAKTRFKTVDGLEIVVESAKVEDKTWVKVAAAYTPPPEPATPPAEAAPSDAPGDTPAGGENGDPPAAGAPAEAAPETPAAVATDIPEAEKKDVAKEAAELNQRLAPWAFEVATYRSDVLARRMKDLIPEPATAGSEDGGLDALMDDFGAEGAPEAGEEPIEPVPAPDDEGTDEPAPDGGETKPE